VTPLVWLIAAPTVVDELVVNVTKKVLDAARIDPIARPLEAPEQYEPANWNRLKVFDIPSRLKNKKLDLHD
jgi:hypothetical protein